MPSRHKSQNGRCKNARTQILPLDSGELDRVFGWGGSNHNLSHTSDGLNLRSVVIPQWRRASCSQMKIFRLSLDIYSHFLQPDLQRKAANAQAPLLQYSLGELQRQIFL